MFYRFLSLKQRNWRGNLKGLPIETEVRDARGLCVQTKKLNLSEDAFFEFNYQTITWETGDDAPCEWVIGDSRPGASEYEAAHSALAPTMVYPLFETALLATMRGLQESHPPGQARRSGPQAANIEDINTLISIMA